MVLLSAPRAERRTFTRNTMWIHVRIGSADLLLGCVLGTIKCHCSVNRFAWRGGTWPERAR